MSILVELVAILVAYLVFIALRRYFIIKSGEQKTNLPFIKQFDIVFGSKDLLFTGKQTLGLEAHKWHEKLGDTFGAFFGEKMCVFTRDPDLVYRVAVTDFKKNRNRSQMNSLSPMLMDSLLEARDDRWQSSRNAIGSVLKASKLKMDNVHTSIDSTASRMIASIDRRLSEAKKRAEDKIDIDVFLINRAVLLQSLLKIIYAQGDMIEFDDETNQVLLDLDNFIDANYEPIQRACFLFPMLTRFVRPIIGYLNHGKCLKELNSNIDEILARGLKGTYMDKKELTTIHTMINSYRKGEMDRQQLMGNALFLIIAGYAATTDSLSALMFELANHQDVQDKLRADLQQYGEGSQYLQQCINETLRFHPGAVTNRDLGEQVFHKHFRLVKGTCCYFSIYSIHKDPRLWGPDANVWNPERWRPDLVTNFHPAQFMPFGLGPRNCVGYNLARLELTKFAAQFLLRYKLELCSKTQKELEHVAIGRLLLAIPVRGPIYLKLSHATNVH